MGTPSDCLDDPHYAETDLSGGYDCDYNRPYDCWTYNIWNDATIEEARDVISKCPASCKLCNPLSPKIMNVHVVDLTTNESPVFQDPLPPGCLDFDGVGPKLSSSPSDAIVQTACLPFPGCYSARISVGIDGQFQDLSRTSFNVSFTDDDGTTTTLVSASQTSDSFDFCLSPGCPRSTPYDPIRLACLPCLPGTYADATSQACISCPRNTFSPEPGATECTQCPDRFPISAKGSNSTSDCFSKNVNLYAVSPLANRISAYSPDGKTFETVVEDDGILYYCDALGFITPEIMIVANLYGGNLVLYDISGEFLGIFANVSSPPDVLGKKC